MGTMQGGAAAYASSLPPAPPASSRSEARSDLKLWSSSGNQWRTPSLFSLSRRVCAGGARARGGVDSTRVRATWSSSKGSGGGSGGEMEASCERSEAANEDILVFFFQLDFGTRIQYALNLEQYEIAQELRNKLAEVETEIVKHKEARRGSSAKGEAQDKAINLLRLRADLQKAIESESYAVAAELRDEISSLESESLAASAKALAYENVQYSFRLGQKVQHEVFGYQAAVCGMDPVCCESTSWMETAQVEKLTRGPNQPFYQVLVNVHSDPNLLVTYVAEESLSMCDQPNTERFDHPYLAFLFYGMDSAGDFIPVKQLRDKYNRPRHEVFIDMNNEDEGLKDD